MNIVEILEEAAARHPERAALVWGPAGAEQTLSFGTLAQGSRRIAALLASRGLRAGDAVVLFLPMSGALYKVLAAVLRQGMTAVFVDPSSWRATLEEAITHLPVRGFVGTPAACALRWITPALRRIAHAFVAGPALPGTVSLRSAEGLEPPRAVLDRADEATALVTFTGGTTGRPKGVLRSHGMLTATHHVLSRHLDLQAGQVHLALLPFFVLANLGAGATSVLPSIDLRSPASADPLALLAQLRAWKVSGVVGSPFLLERLAEACLREEAALETLRSAFAGGAPVLPSVLDKIAAMAPHAQVAALYGATEAEPIALAERGQFGGAERLAMRAGRGLLAGKPIEEVALRIVADRWGTPLERLEPLPPGREGEIVVSGAHVSSGYLGGAANATNKIVAQGVVWHRTGDAGYLDEAGRLWLVGRCAGKALTDEGAALYPLRVEAALSGLPGIAHATLVQKGERRILAVEAAGVLDLNEVAGRVAWCRAHEVVQVPHMPMDRRHHGKVDLAALREILARATTRS